jgi:hypothetical protein
MVFFSIYLDYMFVTKLTLLSLLLGRGWFLPSHLTTSVDNVIKKIFFWYRPVSLWYDLHVHMSRYWGPLDGLLPAACCFYSMCGVTFAPSYPPPLPDESAGPVLLSRGYEAPLCTGPSLRHALGLRCVMHLDFLTSWAWPPVSCIWPFYSVIHWSDFLYRHAFSPPGNTRCVLLAPWTGPSWRHALGLPGAMP